MSSWKVGNLYFMGMLRVIPYIFMDDAAYRKSVAIE